MTTNTPRPPTTTPAAVPVSGGHPEAASIAMKYLGIPYQWGGASPGTGFDCSGLVMYVFAQLGVQLPHFAAGQYGYGSPVSRDQLQPGDLVFFDGLSHVGIYIGNGQMVHAPQTGDVVKITAHLGLRQPLRRSQANLSSRLVNLVRLRRIRFLHDRYVGLVNLVRLRRTQVQFARAQLVFDRCEVEPARGEQHVEVVDEVGGLFDDSLVALVERGDRQLDRLLPDLAGDRADTGVEQLLVYEPAGRSAARSLIVRQSAGAKHESDVVWHTGPAGMTRMSSASPSQSSRSSSTASVLPDVSPLRHSCSRERLQNQPSPVSRVSRSASSFIQASISTRPVAASCTIAGRSVIGAAPPARRSSSRSDVSRSGSSCRIDASNAACATPSASATCCALPAPPDAITGRSTASETAAVSSRS